MDRIKIKQGATFRFSFRWHEEGPPDGDGNPTVGDAYDNTGLTARMQVRAKKQGGDIMIDATTENGMIVGEGTNGRWVVTVPPTVTSLITSKKCFTDFEAYQGADTYIVIPITEVEVAPNVTQEEGEPVLK